MLFEWQERPDPVNGAGHCPGGDGLILEKNFTNCTRLLCTKTADGRGAMTDTWSTGETVQLVFTSTQSPHGHANKTVTDSAQRQDAVAEYTVFSRRAVSLPFHAVIRREEDGRIFRILSDAADTCTPKGAKLDLRMYAAEEYKLPDGAADDLAAEAAAAAQSEQGTQQDQGGEQQGDVNVTDEQQGGGEK